MIDLDFQKSYENRVGDKLMGFVPHWQRQELQAAYLECVYVDYCQARDMLHEQRNVFLGTIRRLQEENANLKAKLNESIRSRTGLIS